MYYVFKNTIEGNTISARFRVFLSCSNSVMRILITTRSCTLKGKYTSRIEVEHNVRQERVFSSDFASFTSIRISKKDYHRLPRSIPTICFCIEQMHKPPQERPGYRHPTDLSRVELQIINKINEAIKNQIEKEEAKHGLFLI